MRRRDWDNYKSLSGVVVCCRLSSLQSQYILHRKQIKERLGELLFMTMSVSSSSQFTSNRNFV